MSDQAIAAKVSEELDPYADRLGRDLAGYTNHVIRVLLFCDAIHAVVGDAEPRPSERPEYICCAVYHDLGIWTDRTFDYLVPSIDLAVSRLEEDGRGDLAELVTRMIDNHHKVTAAGAVDDPVEIFRRADTIDVSLGLRRFGVPFRRVREIQRAHRDEGFHLRLIQLTAKRMAGHPLSPLPMFKW